MARHEKRTDLTRDQIAVVVTVLRQMVSEESSITDSLAQDERGRGPMDRVAKRLGVTQGSISHYIGGARNPGSTVAEALMRAGRLDPTLFRGSSPELAIVGPDAPRPVVLTHDQIAKLRGAVNDLLSVLDALQHR